ncbi:phosphoglycerol geranylgeranyltransferase [Haladaptatus sp. NG-WS-4]
MSDAWSDWKHVTKVDPDERLHGADTLTDVAETGTDAIVVGGTTNVTEAAVLPIVDALSSHDVPLFVEPTYRPSGTYGGSVAGYLIPVVLNAGDPTWLAGAHKEWVRSADAIDWERTHTEAYLVLNPDSAVARYTRATCDLSATEVAAYAEVAEQMLGQELVYIESSGMLAESGVVAAASDALSSATLFYGGGIRDYESAYEMALVADTVVVGDLLHENGVAAVADTVRGAAAARRET